MLGTTVHGRSRTYAYYTCFSRHRYGPDRCPAERIPAPELEETVLEQVMAMLDQEPLIREAVEQALAELEADMPRRDADRAAVSQEIRQASATLDRYLDAFEKGTMSEAVCGPRVEELGKKIAGLEARFAELTTDAEKALYAPDEEELEVIAAEVRRIIEEGDPKQIKALLQAYVKEITCQPRRDLTRASSCPWFDHRRALWARQDSNLGRLSRGKRSDSPNRSCRGSRANRRPRAAPEGRPAIGERTSRA